MHSSSIECNCLAGGILWHYIPDSLDCDQDPQPTFTFNVGTKNNTDIIMIRLYCYIAILMMKWWKPPSCQPWPIYFFAIDPGWCWSAAKHNVILFGECCKAQCDTLLFWWVLQSTMWYFAFQLNMQRHRWSMTINLFAKHTVVTANLSSDNLSSLQMNLHNEKESWEMHCWAINLNSV